MARDQRNGLMFWVLLLILGVAIWYGGVFAGTSGNCSNGEVWVWSPPPHWRCLSGFNP